MTDREILTEAVRDMSSLCPGSFTVRSLAYVATNLLGILGDSDLGNNARIGLTISMLNQLAEDSKTLANEINRLKEQDS